MAALNLLSFACIACASAFPAAGFAADSTPRERAFEWGADVVNSDFRSGTMDLAGNVRVTQGLMSIDAQNATARDFRSDASRWTFRDSVRIRTAQADLFSNSANASFINGRIADARIEGSPARFAQLGGADDRKVQGRAGVIEYDFNAGVVHLRDQVWFSNGTDEFRGDVVIYNVRDERIQINPDGQSSGRVRGIIRPRERDSGVPSPRENSAATPDGNGE